MGIAHVIQQMVRVKGFTGSSGGGGGEDPRTPVPFFVIAGQSNCGRSQTSEMTAPQLADYAIVIPNSHILNPAISTTAFNPLEPGANTRLANPIDTDEFGPEASLFKSFTSGDRYILKYGVGGSTLATQWLTGQSLNNNLRTYLENAIIALQAEGFDPELKAFIWMQGENDAVTEAHANAYLTNLTNFFSELRTYWINKNTEYNITGLDTDFKKVIGRINGISDPLETYRLIVREAQEDYCANPANNAVLIDTDSYPLRDTVHYSATGQIQFGIDIYGEVDAL